MPVRAEFRPILVCIIAAFQLLLIAGCVAGKTYRPNARTSSFCVELKADDCATESLYIVGDPDAQQPALMGFAEFDDVGHLRSSLPLSVISGIARSRPVLLLVFAHGWKHNAHSKDANVRDFTKTVIKLAEADSRLCAGKPCQGRQVVGIYLGWRGLSNRLEPFKTLTFWRRKAVAHHIGTDGAAQIIAQLGRIKSNATSIHNGGSVLIVVGHSFGSALIYESLKQSLMRDLNSGDGSGELPRSTVDTAILVNPAFEAARFTTLREVGNGFNPEPGQAPLLTIFTSEGDLATRRAFPLGRGLANIFNVYSKDFPQNDQRQQDAIAIGHFHRFWTHSLSHQPDPERYPGGWTFSDKEKCRFLLFTQGRSNLLEVEGLVLSRLEPDDPAQRYESPFWVVRVSREIIVDHNKIWGDDFSRFIFYLVLQAAHEESTGCPPTGLDEWDPEVDKPRPLERSP